MGQFDADEACETDSAQAVAEELRAAIGRFVRAARTGQLLPPGQVRALGFLDREGAMAITALAQRERVRHQSMDRTVRLLLEQDLVTLHSDVTDRRRVLVQINVKGRGSLAKERVRRSSRIATALRSELTSDEMELLAQFPSLLDKLTDALG